MTMKPGGDRPPHDRPAGQPGPGKSGDSGEAESHTNASSSIASEAQLTESHTNASSSIVSESQLQHPDMEDDGDADTMEVYASRVHRGANNTGGDSASAGGSVFSGSSGGDTCSGASTDGESQAHAHDGVPDEATRRAFLSQPGAYAVTPVMLPRTSLRRSINGESLDNPSRRSSGYLSTEAAYSEFTGTAATAPNADAMTAASEYNTDQVHCVEAVAVCDDVVQVVPVDDIVLREDDGDGDVEEGGDDGGKSNWRRSSDGMIRKHKWVFVAALAFVAAVALCATVLTRDRGGSSGGDGNGVGNADNSDAAENAPSRPNGGAPNLMAALLEFEAKALQTCPTKGHPDICGGCWCLGLSADNNYQCPEMPDGTINGCTSDERREELAATYESFVQIGAPKYIKPSPVLQSTGLYALLPPDSAGISPSNSSNGTESASDLAGSPRPCDPFSFGAYTHDESKSKNPFHGLEPCYPQALEPPYLNNPEPGMACSYKYTDTVSNLDECQGREYELRSYSSPEQAIADGAEVVHDGPCGFCSNAHDRAAFIRHRSLIKIAFGCREKFSHPQGGGSSKPAPSENDPPSLTQCILDTFQISQPCGSWISTSIFSYIDIFCSDICLAGGTPPWKTHGAPPECAMSECKECYLRKQMATPSIALAGNEPFLDPHDIAMLDEFARCETKHILPHLFDPCDGLL